MRNTSASLLKTLTTVNTATHLAQLYCQFSRGSGRRDYHEKVNWAWRVTSVVAALSLALVGLVGVGSETVSASTSARTPRTSSNLELVAQRDNPLLQGRTSHEYMNTDLAFSGDYLIQGNFDGFSVWDIKNPANPTLASAVECAGGQGDVSVAGNLVILSVDETMSSDRCDAGRVAETASHWDGLRIFDISDPAHPEYVKSIQTPCGSHTNTLVPTSDSKTALIYVSAYSRGPSTTCNGVNPLQIVSIPLDDPKLARVVADIDLFAGRDTFSSGDLVSGGASTRPTSGCHDMTVYKNRAAAACRGDGLLLDISHPLKPKVLDQVRDKEMSFWHSAIFTNNGASVLFQDEMGDGLINACGGDTSRKRGADAIWAIEGNSLTHTGYFKIPRTQSNNRRCTSHNGNMLPIEGREVMVQAWYEGGISLVDVSNPAKPKEIGYAQWPSYSWMHEFTAGIWSAYYYNGHIFASDMWSGLSVFALTGSEFADAERFSSSALNPQNQPEYNWVWKTEPTVPADTSPLPQLSLSSTELTENSGTTAEDVASRTVTVTAPASTFTPGDTVDVWLLPTAKVLATAVAGGDGGLAATKVELPASTRAGEYTFVARADKTPDKLAIAVITVKAPIPWVGIIATGVSVLVVALLVIWIVLRIRFVRSRGRRRA